MGWITSIILLGVALLSGEGPSNDAIMMASGLFAIAGAISFLSSDIRKK
jgi:hypothetical protein